MFWIFAAAMFCFIVGSVRTIDIMKNGGELLHVPISGPAKLLYRVASLVVNLGVLAMFFIGFFAVEWWQVLLATVLSAFVAGFFARGPITGSTYIWVIVLAGAGLFFSKDIYAQAFDPAARRERCISEAAKMPTEAGVYIKRNMCNKQ